MSAPDWIKPGARVVVLSGRNQTPSPTLTIDRVLKRDIVLSNGDRWSLARVARDGTRVIKHGHDSWSPSSALMPADSPQVEEARRRLVATERRANAVSDSHTLTDHLRAGRWEQAAEAHRRIGAFLSEDPT